MCEIYCLVLYVSKTFTRSRLYWKHFCKILASAVMNLQVLYLQVVNTDVTAKGVIDSSHCPINVVQFLPQLAQLSCGLPGRKQKQIELLDLDILLVFMVMQLHFYVLRMRLFHCHINVHLSRTSWLRSQAEARDTSELKPVMLLSVELLREDNLSSSCTR